MPFVTRQSLLWLAGLAIVGAASATGFVYSGLYNIAADDPHTRPVHAALETLRERSIDARASAIAVPDLDDPALIRQGAGNYDAMCTQCHLAPGMGPTELSKGLYPPPPALATVDADDDSPEHHFWVIKHGIKASGMPAWGKSMDDRYIWGMVALVRQLPKLDAAHYRALVASSGGHSHGGGESGAHRHDDADAHGLEGMDAHGHDEGPAHEHDAAAPDVVDESKPHTHAPGTSPHPHDDAGVAPATYTHRHADGTVETHPVAPQEPAAETHDDDHHHEH